jgi:fluoride ion exporter CrcB/FEX
MLDTLTVLHGGERLGAIANVVAQTVLGLVCVFVGYQLAAQR